MNKSVFINDVGPRDGLQNQNVQIEPTNRITLIEKLLAAGLPAVELASFVNPKAVPRMAGADEIMQHFKNHKAKLSVLVPNMKGYEMARDAGAKTISVVPAATETMNQKNINMSLEQTITQSCEMLQAARKDGVHAQSYIAVAVECPYEGLVPPSQILSLAETLLHAGAQELIIADTIGAANPAQVKSLFGQIAEKFGADIIAAHFHDTRAMGLANAYAALELGIRKFDASIGGLGGCPFAPGAAGNLATEDLVSMLHQMGYETGIDEDKLQSAIDFAGALVGLRVGGRMSEWFETRPVR